jgi:hypothetical protein
MELVPLADLTAFFDESSALQSVHGVAGEVSGARACISSPNSRGLRPESVLLRSMIVSANTSGD